MKHIFGAKSKLLVSLLALICIMAVGGTMAYLFASTNPLINTFSSAELNTGIVETGTGTDKTVTITNKGKSPAWVRARLLVSGIDPADVAIVSAREEAKKIVADSAGKICLILSNKTEDGANGHWQAVDEIGKYVTLMQKNDGGWIYYKEPLASGATTSKLLEGVVFGSEVNANDISITVTHESVLAINTNPTDPVPWKTAFNNPAGSVPTT